MHCSAGTPCCSANEHCFDGLDQTHLGGPGEKSAPTEFLAGAGQELCVVLPRHQMETY